MKLVNTVLVMLGGKRVLFQLCDDIAENALAAQQTLRPVSVFLYLLLGTTVRTRDHTLSSVHDCPNLQQTISHT